MTMERKDYLKESYVWEVFQRFDVDSTRLVAGTTFRQLAAQLSVQLSVQLAVQLQDERFFEKNQSENL